MSDTDYTLAELCICACAEAWRDAGEILATGIGLIPRLPASLAYPPSTPAGWLPCTRRFPRSRPVRLGSPAPHNAISGACSPHPTA